MSANNFLFIDEWDGSLQTSGKIEINGNWKFIIKCNLCVAWAVSVHLEDSNGVIMRRI